MQEIEDLTFEQAFEELEQIVAKLESGGLKLQESLDVFERGQALSTRCGILLDEAELKIRAIGTQGEVPFDPSQ